MFKNLFFLSFAMAFSGLGLAQELGRVISSAPIIGQIQQPRNVCSTEQVVVEQPRSGAGAVMGALAGGALGNAVGGGGRAVATMAGIMGGAIVGDNLVGRPMAQIQNVQRCSTQTFFENRTVGYNVVYEYAGRHYAVQMPNDPGPTIPLQISPLGATSQAPQTTATAVYQQPVYVQPTTMVITQPAYPVYERNYYPPISLNLGFGYWGSGYSGRHSHWR